MHAPQIIYVCLMALSLGVTVQKGDGRNTLTYLLANAVTLGLLIWGGFFG